MSLAVSLSRRRALLAAAAAALLLPLAPAVAQQSGEITPADALARHKAGQITLIDVRTPEEWRDTGIAPGVARINMYHPDGAEGFTKEVLAKVGGRKDAPIAFICRSGNRSGQVQRYLAAQGFTRVYSVSEGMSGSNSGPGWISRGLPVEACKLC